MNILNKAIWNIMNVFGYIKKKMIPLPGNKEMVQLTRLYATIIQINKIMIHVHDSETLFHEICLAAIEHGQFQFTWIGLIDTKSLLVIPVATAGESNGYLINNIISIRNDTSGNGPIGRTIREGHCVVIHDIATDPSMLPWREQAMNSGLHGAAAVPVRQNGVVIGAFIVYASESMFFDEKEIQLLEEIGSDISFALDNIEKERQRNIAIDALHVSEKHFSDLLENVNLIAIILDINGNITFCNPYLLQLTHYSMEELLGNSWYDTFVPKELSEARSVFFNGITSGDSAKHYENPIVTKKGELRYILWSNTILRDSSDTVIGTASIGEDITERKQAEESLRASELLFSRIFELNPLSISIARLSDGKLTKVNNVWCKLMGYSEEESIGHDISELKIISEEQRGAMREQYMQKRSLELFESEITTKNGDLKTILTSAETISIKEELYSINILVDITERKQTEEQIKLLSRAVEQSPVIVIISDKEGNIEYVNPKFTESTGYNMEEVKGKNPRILQSGEQSFLFYQELWTTIISGKNWHGLFHNKKKNGELYWENAVISSILNSKGEISHFLAVKEDVTELRSLMKELILAKEKAEESDRLKTAFLHNISHEIRTPVNAIVGFSGLLSNPSLPIEKRCNFTDIIIHSSTQLLAIITDLIDIATIEAGQEKLNESVVKTNSILKLLFEQFSLKAKKDTLKLAYSTSLPDKNDRIITDETKLLQILTNLIGNSMKFTKKGHVDFGYLIKDDTIEFFVKDTGIGIAANMHEEIFNRFRQVENTATRQFGGSGLGLSISKSYAELLGGKMWVESELGKGSNFYFTIPYKTP